MEALGEQTYLGGELDLFALATNWKRYVRAEVRPFLSGDVLEVGAGIGTTTIALHDGSARRWVCLEPDRAQAGRLKAIAHKRWGDAAPDLVVGSLQSLPPVPAFDCVLYMDVLEHIQHDRSEVEAAAARLRAGGHLVVLSPAHQWLYSPFDRQIGHVRRYTKRTLSALKPGGFDQAKLRYLDCFGLFLSLGNLLMLRQALPTERQIRLWDRLFVPASRIADRILLGTFGKSVLAVWRKTDG